MVQVSLVFTYLFLVLVIFVSIVLLCLGSGCHVHFVKGVRCLLRNAARCYTTCCGNKGGGEKRKSVPNDEEEAQPPEHGAASNAGCCAWVPWVLSCGMCCGAFSNTAKRPRRGASIPIVMGQPVRANEATPKDMDIYEIVGVESVVAVSMPLLSL